MFRRQNARTTLALLVTLAILAAAAPASAAFRNSGAGGCGQFADSLAAAEAGDVLAPMRGGVNTDSAAITKSLVIQGGWAPGDSADCTSLGTNEFVDAAALLAAGFSFDPDQPSSLFGNGSDPVLPISLATGQTAALQNLEIGFQTASGNGLAISGVISGGARLRLENLRLESNQAGVNGRGGAIYLEVRGGSQLVIADSSFVGNNALSGGAVEVRLYDGSSLLVENSSFSGNNALSENGGALRVVIERGSATLRGNSFADNDTTNGEGAVAFERAAGAEGTAIAVLSNNSFSGNSALSENDLYADGVAVLEPRLHLPTLAAAAAPSMAVQITGLALSEAAYQASFSTSGYVPQLPGQHIHFFFDTVPPSEAGAPGSGPWRIYGDDSPFRGYTIADRPAGATQLCALVANPDHSVIQGSGNCLTLP